MQLRRSIFDRTLQRPVAAAMAFLLCLLLGSIAYQSIPVALLPRGFQSPSLWVTIPYPGGTPREAEQTVAIPAEEMLRTIPDVKEIQTVCGPDSVNITVKFGWQVDMDLAYAEVTDRLERARPTWPEAIEDYFIFRFNSNTDLPIQWFAVLYDETQEDPHTLYDSVLKPTLEAIDGVARVEVMGLPQQIVRVALNRDKVESARVSLFELARKLQGDNFRLPVGEISESGQRALVRVDAKFDATEQVMRLPVRDSLVLGDLTDSVALEDDEQRRIARINGKQALVFAVSKVSTANTVKVGEALEKTLEELQEHPRLRGTKIFTFFSQKDVIISALDGVKRSALIGGILAILILNLFLRRLKLTIVVAMAIPTSILMALIVLFFQGRSFNVLSLAGFTLAVGMLVDNAIVVIENISRRRADGLSAREAASKGTSEIAMAITMATLTTIVVFLPLVFMSEDRNARIILSEVAGPISFSLLASLVTALVFLPLVALFLLRKTDGTAVKEGFTRRLSTGIRRPLHWCLRHRFVALMLFLGILGTMPAAFQLTRKGFEGGGEGGTEVGVNLRFQSGFTLADADRASGVVEDWLNERAEELGIKTVTCFAGRRSSRVTAYFSEDLDKELLLRLPGIIRDGLPEQAGVRYRIGRETGSGRSDVRVELEGRDSERLADMAEELVGLLSEQPDLLNVRSDLDRGMDEVRIRLDRDLADRMGVGVDSLRGAVAWGLAGVRISEMDIGRREVPIRLEYEGEQESNLLDLQTLPLMSMSGNMVPLEQLADIDVDRGPGAIVRKDGRTLVGLTITPGADNRYQVSRQIHEVMDSYEFPVGYGWVETDGAEDFEESLAEIARAFLLAVVLVFLLMGILFESAFLPLSVLPAVPVAVLGAFWGLAISRVPLDGTGMAGLVILAGIVVNNAIVLVDQINRNRKSGQGRESAILDAAQARLRPILMTALTTIAGLIPMAFPQLVGAGSGGLFSYQALAMCVLGGLALSTALTPFIVPLCYTFFDDLARGLSKVAVASLPARIRGMILRANP